MSRTRSERRHHHQRMIDKVKTFRWMSPEFYHGEEEQRQKHIKKMAENRKKCSCHMCGNPRKMFKEDTMQEKRVKENEKCDRRDDYVI